MVQVFVSPTVVVVLYFVVLWMVRVFAGSVTVIVVTPEYTVTVGGTAGTVTVTETVEYAVSVSVVVAAVMVVVEGAGVMVVVNGPSPFSIPPMSLYRRTNSPRRATSTDLTFLYGCGGPRRTIRLAWVFRE